MNSIKTAFISGIAALALFVPTAAEAAPSFRVSATGVNSSTGTAARVSGGYNSNTGARYGHGGSYNASTQSYHGSTRAYNPSTGNGFTSSTSAAYGSGVNTSVNTVNNGSYECQVSQDLPAHCVQTSY